MYFLSNNKNLWSFNLLAFLLLSFWHTPPVEKGGSFVKAPAEAPAVSRSGETAEAVPFILVKDGQAHVPIIVYEDAPPRTVATARELADYIAKISGGKPEVIVGTPNPVPASAVWVGYQQVLDRFFPGTDFNFQHPEEVLIKSNGRYLVIAGRDRWVPGKMSRPARRKGMVEGVQQEYGTCNAIYTFLQDYLDVRWLGPGEIWEDIVPRQTITLPEFDYRYHPQFRSRAGTLFFTGLGVNMSSEAEQDWARRQRLQYSSWIFHGGHAFTDWWEKYHKDHPEYFALLSNGKREPVNNPKYVKLCVSNPAVWKQWLAEIEVQLQENPSKSVFNASSNDGWIQGHCTCQNCQAWDAVPLNSSDPNLADRHIQFANQLANLLKEKYPKKNYFVKIGAYGDYGRKLPLKTTVNENVLITSVHQFYLRPLEVYPNLSVDKAQFKDWNEKVENLVWRPNLPNYAGHQQGMPDIALRQCYEAVQFAARYGAKGLFIDTHWNHWSTQGPHYYLLSQLAWNPYQDFEAIMDDFYHRAYGPAHEIMRQYWELMEKTRTQLLKTYPQSSFLLMHTIYDENWVQRARGYLKQAMEKVKGDQKYADRIQFNQFGLDMVDRMLQLRRLRHRFELGKGTEADKRKIDAIWAEIKKHQAMSPPDAFNYAYVLKNPSQGRMQALHYDYELSKKGKRSLKKVMTAEEGEE